MCILARILAGYAKLQQRRRALCASKGTLGEECHKPRLLRKGIATFALHKLFVALHIKLGFQTVACHRSNLSKKWAVWKWPVMISKAPSNTHVTIFVTSIQRKFVIEFYSHGEGFMRLRNPYNKLLAPIHAHVIVHVTGCNHFPLGCIPPRVVCLPTSQIVFAICFGTRILLMLGEGCLCPVWDTIEIIISIVVETEVSRQLPPNDQLLQKGTRPTTLSVERAWEGFAMLQWHSFLYLQSNIQRRYLTEM
mmetsp:Transcript_108245/g.191721  ORF Transcript_108245/g.191721 Transcript_108245/m.191721 type:complete len:250 (-) Transcript_108245:881-1630(-)